MLVGRIVCVMTLFKEGMHVLRVGLPRLRALVLASDTLCCKKESLGRTAHKGDALSGGRSYGEGGGCYACTALAREVAASCQQLRAAPEKFGNGSAQGEAAAAGSAE